MADAADPDLALLDRWRAGDADAGNQLFKRHFPSVYKFFEHKTDGEVDDLVQETFLACVNNRETFRRQSSFRTYLFAIARNVLLGHWRRAAGARPTLDFEEISIASLSTSVGTRFTQREDRGRLLAALRALPVEQQILLEMFYWEDLDRDQLAEVFEVETATIGSRLYRARQALQTGLGTDDAALDGWARSVGRA
jgi:RNA polymerase sigma-70 factor (ECF subfamily)